MNLIDHLPRDSAFAEAVAEDDELAERQVVHLDTGRKRTPPVSEFSPDVELLAAVYDRLGHLIAMTAAAAGAKRPPKPKPWPRPVTALERARHRQARAQFDQIVAKALPHKARPPDA